MKQEKDILKDCPELKQMPFSVPDGYFESFKAETSRKRVHKGSVWNRTTIAYEMEYGSQIAEAESELSDEDIINYLIYTGVSAEFIEMSK